MRGEAVTVRSRERVGTDSLNDPVWGPSDTVVEDVLVAPATSADVVESTRPDGVQVRYTLYFPKTFDGRLDRCEVLVRGEWLKIVGAPRRWDRVNCPTRWWMTAEAGVVHG